MKNKYFILLVAIILCGHTFASPIDICSLDAPSTGILNTLLNSYYSQSSRWVTYLKPIALQMYWFWFTAELLYQITFKKVLANDINKLWYFVMIRTFTGYMFATIFVDPAFYSGIITYFVNLGSAAGGFSITPNSSNPFGTLSPSGIMNVGNCTWNNAWTIVSGADTGGGISISNGVSLPDLKSIFTIGMPVLTIGVIVYILAAVMALTLFITALEAFIVMNAGVILLGFAGSSWTMGFWNKYLSYVGGIAIRLFVMCLILGLVRDQLVSDLGALAGAMQNASTAGYSMASLASLVGSEIRMFIDVLVCTFLVIKVPAMAGSMLTGTVNSGLGDVIAGASMMLAGAGIAAGLAKMGVNLGSGGGGAGGGAKEAFKDTLRGNGGGGLPSGGGSSSSDAMRTASQTAQSATSSAEKAQGIADLSKDLKGTSAKSNQSSSSSTTPSNNSSNANNTTATSPSSNNTTSNKPSTEPQNSTSGDNNSSGGISGNDKPSTGAPNSQPNIQNANNQNEQKPSKAMQEMIKNKDKLVNNFNKLTPNGHSGAADISVNPHRE